MKVTKLEPKVLLIAPRKKVAAYARVSRESERLEHSLSAQISFYSELIQKNPEWEFAGVYADRFITGTSTQKREELQRLISDCEQGRIDIVLTKSISRFARNTVDLLNIVRHLKAIGVSVRFEKENIDSMTGDGELMLSILAGFAEEESLSISSNIKWAIQKKFEKGETWHVPAFGYRWDGKTFIVQEDEAEVVRRVYTDFLDDVPLRHIAKWMKEEGWPSCNVNSVKYILQNETYTGTVISQRYFTHDPLTHSLKRNEGEMPMYRIENNHEAIIPEETFHAVQEKIKKNKGSNKEAHRFTGASCFSAKIICPCCGQNFTKGVVRSNRHDGYQENWRCFGKIKNGAASCPSRDIKGENLKKSACFVLGMEEFDEKVFSEKIRQIKPIDGDLLEYTFYDGSIKTAPVKYFRQEDKKHTDPHTEFFGYRWSSNGYVIIPEQAEAVKLMYEWYLDGMTISDIRRKLLEMGYKSNRNSMSNRLIANALDSNLYIGERTIRAQFSKSGKDEIIPNDHETVIPTDLNDRVKERRKIQLKKQERRLATIRKKKEEGMP